MKLNQYLLLIICFFCLQCKKGTEAPQKPQPQAKSAQKEIKSFSFSLSSNPELDADYNGNINGTKITVVIPVGINITQLKATFTISDKATAKVSNTIQASGVTINDFSNEVTYTIVAEDNSTATYTITISRTGNQANLNINQKTAYQYKLQTNVWYNYTDVLPSALQYYPGGYLARAIYDFDKDGDLDMIMGNLNFDNNGNLLNSPRPINYLSNEGGTLIDRTSSHFSGTIPGQVHPRKAIIGDFDNNGWMDVVFAGHGFDAAPFPGEQALLMMNNNGTFTATYLNPGGFFHSVASGDIDNDGDIDLFFTDNKNQSKFFINNSSGQFTYDSSIFPSDLSNLNYFTSELYDLNKDGYLDLVIAGHTHESATPMVLWGNYSGKYSKSRSSTLPAIAGWGVIIDINFIDIDGDGLQDIILNRQGDETGTQKLFYGLQVQILQQQSNKSFMDKTSTYIDQAIVTSHPNISWFWVDWLRLYDTNGDGLKDLVADNKFYNCQWRNVNGKFIKF